MARLPHIRKRKIIGTGGKAQQDRGAMGASHSQSASGAIPPSGSPLAQPKKMLGQHFLTDSQILQLEAALLHCKGKTVLEIGAGDGRLSKEILPHAPSSLTLIEIDPALVKLLKAKFRLEKGVKIIEGDALEFVRSAGNGEFFGCVAGNIPYQISGPLFSSLCKLNFWRGVFCIQNEMAERLCAEPGTHDWGRLSVFVQLRFKVRKITFVPSASFDPPPKVDSAVIELTRRDEDDTIEVPPNFEHVVTALFMHRLQSVGNAIYNSRGILGLDKESAKQAANTIKYPDSKVFALSVAQLAEIARALEK